MAIATPDGTIPDLVSVPAEHGATGPCLVWRFDTSRPAVSTAIVGGGVGDVNWVLNMSVEGDYARLDPIDHLRAVAARLGLTGSGIAMMTAVPVERRRVEHVDGAVVTATVGVGTPTWAADTDALAATPAPAQPGTINLVAVVPARLDPGAMVNLATTITEAKTQALLDARIGGTGTATDAVCVIGEHGARPSSFGGPRSEWGARVAVATHRAVPTALGDTP